MKKNQTKKVPLLMTPGPVSVPDEIMDAIGAPIIHHRTEAFEKDLHFVLQRLPDIFKTAESAFILNSTGSGAMEAAVVNTLSPGDKVLCIVGGKFGERWAEICKTYELKVLSYNVPWGEAFKVEEVQRLLKENDQIKAVFCQACETSTGVLNPVQALGALLRTHPAILVVDAITALGATPLAMDEWGLDVVVGGSQKAFMLPTGLSMIAFSKKAWEMVKKSKISKYYFDIQKEKKANEKSQTYFSSPVTHIRALKVALEIILKTGVDEFIIRHETIAAALRESGQALGLKVYAQSPSPTVTAFLLPEGINGEEVQKIMEHKHHISVAGGQEQLKGKIIRIGHMGAIEKEHILATLKALSLTLQELGFQGEKNSLPRALEIAQIKLKNLKPLANLA
jgi:aspartate aminotransferase-like enzyme